MDTERTCVGCGETFFARRPRRGPLPAYCGKRCQKRAEKRRASARRRFGVTFDRIEDRWTGRYYEALAKDPCAYCGAPSEVSDHVEPWSYSGDNGWLNLAPSCVRCNVDKGTRPLLGFLLWRAYAPERELVERVSSMHRPRLCERDGYGFTKAAAARRRVAASS